MTTILPISCIEVAPHLFAEYAEECGFTSLGPPSPQWDIYEAMQELGVLHTYGVYVDSAMVGFANVISSILPHYGVKAATVESLFVSKPYRATGAGTRLMECIEANAALEGCKLVFYSAPAGGKLEKVLAKRYAHTNSVYCKALS